MTHQNNQNQPTKKLIIFPQDKGGIGKSFIATLLYDYLSEAKIRLKTFDLDHANSTFQRFVPESEFIDTDVDANKLGVLDKIVDALERVGVGLVDNPADLTILMAQKLLTPIGSPAQHSTKYFATVQLEKLRDNIWWLDKATAVLNQHSKDKNARKNKGAISV